MSKYIAPHILKSEYACRHCGALPPGLDLTSVSFIYSILFADFEKIRKQWGSQLKISSGYRCPAYQLRLWQNKLTTTPYSVHIFGLALDIEMKTADEVKSLVTMAECIDPELRIGYRQYLAKGQTFVHIDIGYLISPIYDISLVEGERW